MDSSIDFLERWENVNNHGARKLRGPTKTAKEAAEEKGEGPEAMENNGAAEPGKHRTRWTWRGGNRIQWTPLRPAKLRALRMRARPAFPPDAGLGDFSHFLDACSAGHWAACSYAHPPQPRAEELPSASFPVRAGEAGPGAKQAVRPRVLAEGPSRNAHVGGFACQVHVGDGDVSLVAWSQRP